MSPTSPRHFLSIADLQPAELTNIFESAKALKSGNSGTATALLGKGLVYYSEKPSTRTKLSFGAAIQTLGGYFLDMSGSQLSAGKEDVADTARTVGKYAHFLAARVYRHSLLEELARHSTIPVINALSEREHPCQALADLLTIHERKGSNARIAFVGDGFNVAASLALGGCMLGHEVHVATPPDFTLSNEIVSKCKNYSGTLTTHTTPKEAVTAADVVYTDVWTSMGQEEEKISREQAFAGFQVNSELMAHAAPGAIFMHCLPAFKGKEVTGEVFESPASVVFDQAENRMHAQKALLLFLARN